jgi:REP element-mobilizing transposase RayT
MIVALWLETANKFARVALDQFVVMPNHFHGIIALTGTENDKTALPTVIDWFKTMTTNAYIRGVRESNWESFDKRLWQRSYHDHIIRSEDALNTISQYLCNNPAQWADDTFFPKTEGTAHQTNQ